MESVTTIDSVDPKQVKTKYGVKTVWNVSCADGRLYSTFKDEIGKTAGTLRGQTVTVSFSERPWQKDDKSGVNYDLDDVKAAEGITGAPTGRLVLNGEPTATASVSTGVVTHNLTTKKPDAPYVDEKSKQINRSVAFKAAVELYTSGVLPPMDGANDMFDAIAKLTELLIPVVEGTTPAPFVSVEETGPNQSIGAPGDIVDDKGNLVTF